MSDQSSTATICTRLLADEQVKRRYGLTRDADLLHEAATEILRLTAGLASIADDDWQESEWGPRDIARSVLDGEDPLVIGASNGSNGATR